jgi:NAD(P)-dependent dehydrogenase (short-subunit alcohol dehydrogenase family)
MDDSDTTLAGRTALITGAARRLGRAIALALAQQGVHVVVHHNRSADEAVSTCAAIRRLGVSAWPIQADLADIGQAETLFERAVGEAGPIDILVNSASTFEKETIWETSAESLEANLRLHATAPLILARALAGQNRGGAIVNMLDTRVTVYDRQHAAYHISKRVLLTLTRMLALELAPAVAVNAVAPGLILPPAGQDESYLKKLAHCNPLNRYGDPEQVADAVLFLLRSRFITGQVIYVDGGYHMKGHMYD